MFCKALPKAKDEKLVQSAIDFKDNAKPKKEIVKLLGADRWRNF